jgi:hypothetical protein
MVNEHKTYHIYVRFEVLTAVVMKSVVFWDTTPYSPFTVGRSFGGTYRLHFQGRRMSQATNERESWWQADQSACRNFCLYRKQEGNGIQQVSSRWLAHRT